MKAGPLQYQSHDPLPTQASSRVPVGHLLLLVGVSAVLFLLNATSLPLADPEEARCGLIVQDMLRHERWLVPHLRGEPYFDKPAPFFWLAAAAVRLTGSAEFGGRLMPALGGILAVLVTYAFARRVLRSNPAGLLAGLILATSGEFLFMARWYRMDMPFTAAMWGALWWFWRSEDARLTGQHASKTKTWLGFYLLCAVATLFKGPAGLALPILVVLAYFLLSRQSRRILKFFSPTGIAAYLLLTSPWYIAVAIAEPGYAREFFLHQNLQRFTGSADLGHDWPGILYLPIILAGMLPWTIFLPGVVIRYFPRRWIARNDRPTFLFLWLCASVPLVFFAVSSTKLASYVLPVFPPLAVLIGGLLASWIVSRQPDRLMKLGARAMLITVAILPAVPLVVEIWLRTVDAWIAIPFAIAAAAFVAMLYALKRPRRGQFVGLGVAVAASVFVYLILHTAPAGYARMSTRNLAQSVDLPKLQGSRFCFWSNTNLSFPFYAGLEDAQAFHASRPGDLDTLAEWLGSNEPVYCLVSGEKYLSRLRQKCPERLHVVASDDDRWLVTNDCMEASIAPANGCSSREGGK